MTRVFALLLLAACSDDAVTAEPALAGPRLSVLQARVFDVSCVFAACHDGRTPEADLDLTPGAAHGELVGRPATMDAAAMRVLPGAPDSSFLVTKLRGELREAQGEPMPRGDPALPEETLRLIEEWIRLGAADD